MLSKQSIRKEHTIYLNGVLMSKEEILEISKDFSEIEVKRFKKILQQGGVIKIKNNKFEIQKKEYKFRNSKGEYESPIRLNKKD